MKESGRFVGRLNFGRIDGARLAHDQDGLAAALANDQGPTHPRGVGPDFQILRLSQGANLRAALVAVQVRRAARLMADLAGGRDFEPLLDPFVGLQLDRGHDDFHFNVSKVD